MSNKSNKNWMEIPMFVTKVVIFMMYIMGGAQLVMVLDMRGIEGFLMMLAWLTTGVWIISYFEHKQEQKRAERCKEDN